jgi:hypothetical protein
LFPRKKHHERITVTSNQLIIAADRLIKTAQIFVANLSVRSTNDALFFAPHARGHPPFNRFPPECELLEKGGAGKPAPTGARSALLTPSGNARSSRAPLAPVIVLASDAHGNKVNAFQGEGSVALLAL